MVVMIRIKYYQKITYPYHKGDFIYCYTENSNEKRNSGEKSKRAMMQTLFDSLNQRELNCVKFIKINLDCRKSENFEHLFTNFSVKNALTFDKFC